MGKRSTVLLTKRVVDAARPDHERYHVWDASFPASVFASLPPAQDIHHQISGRRQRAFGYPTNPDHRTFWSDHRRAGKKAR